MTASWSAASAPHGSPVSSGPADRPALRWSIAIIRYCPAYAVSGLIAAISHSGTLERIPPGASVSMGNPVPCSVYQIFASPLSTYGTPVSSPDSDSVTQPMAEPLATTGLPPLPGGDTGRQRPRSLGVSAFTGLPVAVQVLSQVRRAGPD